MVIDPTARYTNVRARVNGYLTGLTVTGTPVWVIDGSHPVDSTKWARITYRPVMEQWSGRSSETQTVTDVHDLVVVDLFWPTGDTVDSADLYEIDKAADDVAHGLRSLGLSFLDYSSDPSNPTAVDGARIFVVEPNRIETLDPSGGYARRQVTAEIRWFLRHTQ